MTRGDKIGLAVSLGLMAACFLGLSFLIASGAFGATLQWDRNSEADMKEYHVYTCTPNPTCTVTISAASRIGVVPQPAVGVVPSFVMPPGTEGKVGLTAADTASNESGLSVTIPFDSKAPAPPVGPRLVP